MSDKQKMAQDYVLVPRTMVPSYTEEKVVEGRREDDDMNVRRRGTFNQDDDSRTSVIPTPGTLAVHRALHGIRKASKPIEAWVSYFGKSSGAANTDFAWSAPLQPNLDTSWASWQSTFDEVKVLSAEIHWNVLFTTAPTVQAAQTPNAIVTYEPSEGANLASVNAGMQYEHFQLMNLGGNASGTYPVVPQNTAKGGHLVFRAKMPSGPSLSIVDTLLSTGMWRPTADASNYYWGLFNGYCAQGGTTSVIQVERFVRMRCVFRCRR